MTNVQGVLDLSFYDIGEESDIMKALDEIEKVKLKATAGKKPKAEKPEDEIRAIRYSNNNIGDLRITLQPLVTTTYYKIDLSHITWIDISFNAITGILDEWLANVPNLCTLNMHANQVSKLSDLKKLTVLTKLRSLTLCGNPVAENKHYRNMILYYCGKSLVQLDFGCITNAERQKTAIWEQVYRKKLHPEDE